MPQAGATRLGSGQGLDAGTPPTCRWTATGVPARRACAASSCGAATRSSASAASPTAPSAPAPDGVELPDARARRRRLRRRWPRPASTRCAPTPSPPRWLLDIAAAARAARHGRPAVGAARRVPRRPRRAPTSIERRVRDGVRAAPAIPAVLCYAIGNEIPASIVRWHGRERVERFLRAPLPRRQGRGPRRRSSPTSTTRRPSTSSCRSSTSARSTSTSRTRERARGLPRAAADPRRRPAAGDGRDRPRQPPQRRGGAGRQPRLAARARPSRAGCAGAFVFAWTDEWHRGGHDIEDWDFGLVTATARPKPALARGRAHARRAAAAAPTAAGRGSRSSSAPTTARARSARRLDGARARSTTPTTR